MIVIKSKDNKTYTIGIHPCKLDMLDPIIVEAINNSIRRFIFVVKNEVCNNYDIDNQDLLLTARREASYAFLTTICSQTVYKTEYSRYNISFRLKFDCYTEKEFQEKNINKSFQNYMSDNILKQHKDSLYGKLADNSSYYADYSKEPTSVHVRKAHVNVTSTQIKHRIQKLCPDIKDYIGKNWEHQDLVRRAIIDYYR